MIFYIMGKSASGKDKIYKGLMKTFGARDNAGAKNAAVSSAPDTNESAEVNLHPIILYFRKAGKVIEERTYQTIAGPWTYATVDNGLDPRKTNYLAIGTLVSYIKVRDYFGSDLVIPIYIDVSDKNLLTRAMHREADQENPRYKEMCRRFLADSEDFDEEKITAAGITRRYDNNGPLDDCVAEIARTIAEYCNA